MVANWLETLMETGVSGFLSISMDVWSADTASARK